MHSRSRIHRRTFLIGTSLSRRPRTAISDNQFKWIGKHSFHNKKGELHYVKKGGYVIVEGDITGNGKANFQIKVDDVSKLSADDFQL